RPLRATVAHHPPQNCQRRRGSGTERASNQRCPGQPSSAGRKVRQTGNEDAMNRSLFNLITDLLAALLFLGMVATGYILRFPLPPGTNRAYTLWELTRHEWGTVHFWISVGLLGVLLLHVAVHW